MAVIAADMSKQDDTMTTPKIKNVLYKSSTPAGTSIHSAGRDMDVSELSLSPSDINDDTMMPKSTMSVKFNNGTLFDNMKTDPESPTLLQGVVATPKIPNKIEEEPNDYDNEKDDVEVTDDDDDDEEEKVTLPMTVKKGTTTTNVSVKDFFSPAGSVDTAAMYAAYSSPEAMEGGIKQRSSSGMIAATTTTTGTTTTSTSTNKNDEKEGSGMPETPAFLKTAKTGDMNDLSNKDSNDVHSDMTNNDGHSIKRKDDSVIGFLFAFLLVYRFFAIWCGTFYVDTFMFGWFLVHIFVNNYEPPVERK
jgi:hypothetical protein